MVLWVFDNDGTLYDDSGARKQFLEIFHECFGRLLGIPSGLIAAEATRLKQKWDTEFPILAFVREYGVDFADAVNNTYLRINLEVCIITAPDPLRYRVINALEGRKVVFTNSPSVFARHVLSYIGLAECFSDWIGMEEMQFFSKPDPHSYKTVEDRNPGAEKIIFCDDSLKNLDGARQRGWITVWAKPLGADARDGREHIVISSFGELLSIGQTRG